MITTYPYQWIGDHSKLAQHISAIQYYPVAQAAPATFLRRWNPQSRQLQPRAWNDTRHHLPSRVSGSCNNARTPWMKGIVRNDWFWCFKSPFQTCPNQDNL